MAVRLPNTRWIYIALASMSGIMIKHARTLD